MTRWQNANHKDAPPSGHGSKANTDVTTLKNKQTKKKNTIGFCQLTRGMQEYILVFLASS